MRARRTVTVAATAAIAFVTATALAQKRYDPGASNTEIKVGNISSYTGVFSQYGAVARAEAAYFKMINDRGGINGRKINFVSVDNGSGSNSATCSNERAERAMRRFTLAAQGGGEMSLRIAT